MIDPNEPRIDILEDLDAKQYKSFYREFWSLLKANPEKITIVITSDGGFIWAASAIIDLVSIARDAGIKVTTIGIGKCCSAAAMVFMAGDERLISPFCVFMLHNGSVSMTDRQMASALQEMVADNRQDDDLMRLVCAHTKVKFETVKQRCQESGDWYITPEECVKMHIATDYFLRPKKRK